MFSKVYEKIKKYIKNNYKFIIFLIILTIILNIKTPYIISAPGGVIPLSDRVTVDDKNISSNYYTSYVKVMDGKLAGVIASFVLPNWDLEKYKEYSGNTNLSYDELNKVEKMMMNEGNNTAIILALRKAGADYEITDEKYVVYYKLEKYKNNLKIGDVINSCNDKKITILDDLYACINSTDDNVKLGISRNDIDKDITVPIYKNKDKKLIGISIFHDYKVKSKYNINISSRDSESGSSGGFMTALSLYDYLSSLNLSKKYKIAGSGTIDEEGKVGKISGIKYKLLGANKKKIDIFFVPNDNYKEAVKVKKKHHLKMKIIKVNELDDAINYLKSLT